MAGQRAKLDAILARATAPPPANPFARDPFGMIPDAQSGVGALLDTARRSPLRDPLGSMEAYPSTPEEAGEMQAEEEARRAAERARQDYSPLGEDWGPIDSIAGLGQVFYDEMASPFSTEANARRVARDEALERGLPELGRNIDEAILSDVTLGEIMDDFAEGNRQREAAGQPRFGLGDFWRGMSGREDYAEGAYRDVLANYERDEEAQAFDRGEPVFGWGEELERRRSDDAYANASFDTGLAALDVLPGIGLADIPVNAGRFTARQGVRAVGAEVPDWLRAPVRESFEEAPGALTAEGRQFRNEAASAGVLGLGATSLADRALADEGIDENTSLDDWAEPIIGTTLGVATARQLPRAGEFIESLPGYSAVTRYGGDYIIPDFAPRLPDDAPMGFEGAPRTGDVIDVEAMPAPSEEGAIALRSLRTPEERAAWAPQAVVHQPPDPLGGYDAYGFRGPQGSEIAVSLHPARTGSDEVVVSFEDIARANSDPWEAQGRFSATEARQILNRVVATIEEDARLNGRARYILNPASPEHARVYQAMARTMTPPEGYRIVPGNEGSLQIVREAGAPMPIGKPLQTVGEEEFFPEAIRRMPLLEAAPFAIGGGLIGATLEGEAEAGDGEEGSGDPLLPILGAGAGAAIALSRGRIGEGVDSFVGANGGRPARSANTDLSVNATSNRSGALQERGQNAFSDTRLSPQQNKAVEMLRNGFSRNEIAEELDIDPRQLSVVLNNVRRRAPDLEVGMAPIGRPRGSGAAATDEQIIELRDQLRASGESNERGGVNTIIAERFGMTPGNVAGRISKYEARQRRGNTADAIAPLALTGAGGAILFAPDDAEARKGEEGDGSSQYSPEMQQWLDENGYFERDGLVLEELSADEPVPSERAMGQFEVRGNLILRDYGNDRVYAFERTRGPDGQVTDQVVGRVVDDVELPRSAGRNVDMPEPEGDWLEGARIPSAIVAGFAARGGAGRLGVRGPMREVIGATAAGGVDWASGGSSGEAIALTAANPILGRFADEGGRVIGQVGDQIGEVVDRSRGGAVRGVEFDPLYRAPSVEDVRDSERAARGIELQQAMARRAVEEQRARSGGGDPLAPIAEETPPAIEPPPEAAPPPAGDPLTSPDDVAPMPRQFRATPEDIMESGSGTLASPARAANALATIAEEFGVEVARGRRGGINGKGTAANLARAARDNPALQAELRRRGLWAAVLTGGAAASEVMDADPLQSE